VARCRGRDQRGALGDSSSGETNQDGLGKDGGGGQQFGRAGRGKTRWHGKKKVAFVKGEKRVETPGGGELKSKRELLNSRMEGEGKKRKNRSDISVGGEGEGLMAKDYFRE